MTTSAPQNWPPGYMLLSGNSFDPHNPGKPLHQWSHANYGVGRPVYSEVAALDDAREHYGKTREYKLERLVRDAVEDEASNLKNAWVTAAKMELHGIGPEDLEREAAPHSRQAGPR